MAAQPETAQAVRVALLGLDDEVRAQLRQALVDAGAVVVLEADPRETAAELIRQAGPATVIVNLDARLEPALDGLDVLFDAADLQVVFNESEVTRNLSGWDLARWARHLVAKVLGRTDTVPPPPEGAEPLPLRDLQPAPAVAQEAEDGDGDGDAALAATLLDQAREDGEKVPRAEVPERGEEPDAPEEEAELLGIELETPPPEPDVELAPITLERPLPGSAAEEYLSADEVLTIEGIDALSVPDAGSASSPRRLGPDEPTVELPVPRPEADVGAAPGGAGQPGVTPRRRGPDEPTLELPAFEPAPDADVVIERSAPAASAEDGDLEDGAEASDADLAALEAMLEEGEEQGGGRLPSLDEDEVDLSLDEDVAALAAQLDALADGLGPEAAVLEDVADIGFDLPEPDAEDAPVAPAFGSPAEPGTGGTLSLADPDEPTQAAPASAAPARIEIDTSALSLVPLEDEQPAAPTAVEGIERVVVLGASIGGPDALRTFLGALPEGLPALFVLVQHLDTGFFERLAEQLQKSTRLRVRVAEEGMDTLRMGEVLVLPSDARYRIRRDGRLVREPYDAPPRYKPCIDDALTAVADEFGADTLAIIFSGMAGDAIDGASHVTAKGGEVWGQDPASCVVSSMVDGARARGLLEVVASPRDLASRLVARLTG